MLEYFPKVWMHTGDGDQVLITNIFKRVSIPDEYRTSSQYVIPYRIKEGETYRTIANKLYDDPSLFWVVLLVNNIVDIHKQWPKRNAELIAYINATYDYPDAIRHYLTPQGLITDLFSIKTQNNWPDGLTDAQKIDYSGCTPVTHREYEVAKNDALRDIVLLVPDSITDIVDELEDLF